MPQQIDAWLAAHPNDPRTPRLRSQIASQPTGLWLTGPDSATGLTEAVHQAAQHDTLLTLVLYNIPGRNDGVGGVGRATVAQYRDWVRAAAKMLGRTRAIVVVEPDALWFVDRQTPPGTQAYVDRMTSLRNAVSAFATYSPRARVYLDAGTSSGSVTSTRMAQLLVAAGIRQAAGFAVNISSFAPTASITNWAQGIRNKLTSTQGISNPRYVVDTGRNGTPTWDFYWCNPPGRRLGLTPRAVGSTTGLDYDIWAKPPGTSDGSCGTGQGSYGGQFLPAVAYALTGG